MTESKTSAIYNSLKRAIMAMKYDASEPITEKEVAMHYGVSKTPAREALNKLVHEGYLRKYPRLGYFVNEVSESQYYKLLFLRYTLEQGVVASIIANCTDQEIEGLYRVCQDKCVAYEEFAEANLRFHFAMAEITGNEYLEAAVQNAFAKLVRSPSRRLYQEFCQEPHREHKKLIGAMLMRDKDAAIRILREECRRDDDIQLWF